MRHAATDVVVIGCGPAGASVARELASLGHRVTVLTRQAPRPHLAETIPPSTDKLLRRLHWSRPLEAAGFLRTTGNTVYWSGPEQGRQAFYAGAALGFQVDRGVLNDVFLGGVGETACERIDDATVTAVDGDVVRFVRSSGESEIRTRWVLDCSGRSGVVARNGWRRGVPELRTIALVGVWERADDWPVSDPTHTIVESYADGWAWSVPVSPTQRHVTVMIDPRLTELGGRDALEEAYREELRHVPRLGDLTRGAQLARAPFARDASPYAAHQVAAPGVLLVGDAASFVDPLSSYGIKKALASAWLATVVVHTVLTDAGMQRPALELYEARERDMYAALERQRVELAQAALASGESSDFWTTRLGADVGEDEPNEGVDVAALRADPAVLAAFEEIKRRESVCFAVAARVRRTAHPAVRENRVVLETRLQVDGMSGVRYVRNIDLVALTEIAPQGSQVPELYDVYCQRIAPVPLPDFLGALAFLLARGFLEFA